MWVAAKLEQRVLGNLEKLLSGTMLSTQELAELRDGVRDLMRSYTKLMGDEAREETLESGALAVGRLDEIIIRMQLEHARQTDDDSGTV